MPRDSRIPYRPSKVNETDARRVDRQFRARGGSRPILTGLSMAARTQDVTDPAEAQKALDLLMQKYPQQQEPLPIPMLTPEEVRIFRVTPVVISVLDYAKGFGHADLIAFNENPANASPDSPAAASCRAGGRQ